MKSKTVLILMCCAVSTIECLPGKPTQGKKVIDSVPKSERPSFLSYYLGYGFMQEYELGSLREFPFPIMLRMPPNLIIKFEALEKPNNFTSDLYQFVSGTFRLSPAEMFALILRRKICRPDGKCIDIGNIGELCCPF